MLGPAKYSMILILFGILTACVFQSGHTDARPENTAEVRERDSDRPQAVKEAKPIPESKPQAKRTETQMKRVKYEGKVEHIFFHPLIAYPQRAFDGDRLSKGYNDWFTTVPEFKRIIESLYERDFILVNVQQVYDVKRINGKRTVVRKPLFLPEGKKPLILSIDDLNYYDYMRENGNVAKLVLDESGNVAAYAKNLEGEYVISRELEIIPLLDDFVEKHPDFSHRGAKGLIALTGYQGVLGYRTQRDADDAEAEREKASAVIRRLKETGWTFASHSYGHIHVANASYSALAEDTKRWKKEVASLVGDTNVFIYPFGSRPEHKSRAFYQLVESGFSVLCSVGPTSYTEMVDGVLTMDRRHMDGMAFIRQPERVRDLFDAEYVLDKRNRPPKYWEEAIP